VLKVPKLKKKIGLKVIADLVVKHYAFGWDSIYR
jgi:hypothetical protein